jgi:ferredoxin
MSRLRVFVVLMLLACLPLKVVAAVAMPFCGLATEAASAPAVSMGHGGHGADHAQHAGHAAMAELPADGKPAAVDDCSQCGLCHLACASALPIDIAALTIAFAPVLEAAVPATFLSFIPEVLFRPPLHLPLTALA